MTKITSLAATAALIGDPTRTSMLLALMDGRALSAGELAGVAGITPPTASGHLAKMVDGVLLTVVTQGRHRYFRLASPAVATMIEGMMGVAGLAEQARASRAVVTGPKDHALRRARVCYDHLAGELAVALADALVEAGHVTLSDDGASLTLPGVAHLRDFGIDFSGTPGGQRFCRPCLDWSERRPHLAGRVGRLLFSEMMQRDWLRRGEGRLVSVTRKGEAGLRTIFGMRTESVSCR